MVLYFTAHTIVMFNIMHKINVLALLVLAAMTLSVNYSIYGQPMGNANQSTGGNASQDVGNAQKLTQSLGNNSEILANNTPIGNPNASMAEKAAMESNATSNQIMQTGNETGNQSGNQSNPISGLLEGIGKLLGNATGK
jgi:hypothetical protein